MANVIGQAAKAGTGLTPAQVADIISQTCKPADYRGKRILLIVPDGTRTAPGHVGLVIGNGEMIEAYATGFPIRVAGYANRDPVGFTRPWAAGATAN